MSEAQRWFTGPLPVQVETLQAASMGAWDRYVDGHRDGSFFHLAGWREVLAAGVGFNTHFLLARRGGLVVGVLPLARVRSWLFGDALVSLPFCVHSGLLADDADAAAALLGAACTLTRQLGVDYLELRHTVAQTNDWPAQGAQWALFSRTLAGSDEANLNAIPRKQRAVIRKALSSDLRSTADADPRHFLPLYATSVRNLGTPVFPARYFAALWQTFGARSRITTVWAGDNALSSVWSFVYKDAVLPYYAGALPAARPHKAFDFMYWALMCESVEAGLQRFDFGRSRVDSGAYAFKKNWGFTPAPVHYEYQLGRAQTVPAPRADSGVLALASRVWRHLPLPLANRLGPLVSPYLA